MKLRYKIMKLFLYKCGVVLGVVVAIWMVEGAVNPPAGAAPWYVYALAAIAGLYASSHYIELVRKEDSE